MKLTRRERPHHRALTPTSDLNRIRSEISRIFEEPFRLMAPTSFFEGWTPSLDVYEDKDKYVVTCELPGMRKEDIDLSLDANTLTISGERKEEEEKRKGEAYRSERYFGRFQRSLTLPVQVQADKIEAGYKNGLLRVTLPKSEAAKPKPIQVKTA